jgi:hypothetical protein
VDDLDVAHVVDDVVLEQHAVAAQHVARVGDHLLRLDGLRERARC